jgi:hypothetical protein
MKLIMRPTEAETTDIEQLLRQAGIEFTVVARCPDPGCDICAGSDVVAAA